MTAREKFHAVMSLSPGRYRQRLNDIIDTRRTG